MRTIEQRIDAVRRVLEASRRVFASRADLAPEIERHTGLSSEGVELGFGSLEVDATDDELARLVAAAGDAQHVHVVLSANVFVAAVRALALAAAAAPRVTLRPSSRDPTIARALVAAARGLDLALVETRTPVAIGADAIHVYGRNETIEDIRAQVPPQVVVVGHGAGIGAAFVTASAHLEHAAASLALDVVTFDQRGCLSPRVAWVEGPAEAARAFARRLSAQLTSMNARFPRGAMAGAERAEAARWGQTVSFAGELLAGDAHAVGCLPEADLAAIPPPGRHVLVVPAATAAHAKHALDGLAQFIVAVGSDERVAAEVVAPPHARVLDLGRMQRPPLDGPVDRRTAGPALAVT